VLEAGKRLRARGTLPIEKYGIALKKSCVDAEVPEIRPGQFRHSVATWAINEGEDPASVAAFLNHKSPRTTMRFYATHAAEEGSHASLKTFPSVTESRPPRLASGTEFREGVPSRDELSMEALTGDDVRLLLRNSSETLRSRQVPRSP
jgi:hypothetical protein